ncbi:hypothetical protein FSARC_14148 [Fusarium sarcochroum]|uniref:NmrA-like domain-containing protein n=1 Tax=Fusarium sarcochroum TaxID=1208366 RepID=A0A8H4SW21_9HYPO|nr:hypothetical protein FSARC_14148 [Fusarium sarcochroum]
MAIIAVAGGTGGIGRALVEAIVARGKHEVKILSHKTNGVLATEIGSPILVVDYSSVDNLKNVLEDHDIHTVISALNTLPEGGVPPEVNLVRAAQASKTTRRFIPSNWGVPLVGENVEKLPSTGMKAQTIAELDKTDLEHTSFYVGFLTDFYGTPGIKTYMSPVIMVLDLVHNMAPIPGSGNTPVVFTHTFDVAKYVALALDLEKWEPGHHVVGDKLTWNEFVKIAEEAKGTKFKVVYDSIEDLQKGIVTELPGLTKALPYIPVPKEALLAFSAMFGLVFDDGTMNFDEETAINRKFPQVQPLKIKDAVQAAIKAAQV